MRNRKSHRPRPAPPANKGIRPRRGISGTPGQAEASGPERVPLQGGNALSLPAEKGDNVDGISCQASEQVAYHIHARLEIFDAGRARALPAGIGIVVPHATHSSAGDFDQATTCYYWLHTHARDGVIHIESPDQRVFTLGQLFDEWHQPLTAMQVATLHGAVVAYVDGRLFDSDPRTIPLVAHTTIQLDVGGAGPKAKPFDWAPSGL
jgi:hypothetical protein